MIRGIIIALFRGVSRSTRTCVATSFIGATSLEVEIRKRKGILFGQLCRLDTYFAVKQLFLYGLTSKFIFNDAEYGFVYDVYQLFSKHVLSHMVDSVNTGNFLSKQSSNLKLKNKRSSTPRYRI